MKNIFYISSLGLLLSSCGGESATSENVTDTAKTDIAALVPENDEINQALLEKFKISTELPFVQDSVYLANLSYSDTNALTVDEAKYLSFGFVDSDVSYRGLSPVDDFYFFDSLKVNDGYESFMEVIDIGMMIRSDAFIAQKVIVDDSTSILLWIVDYATYEACPYASGKVLYASVLRNNVVTSCTILGEDSSGADAPIWSETLSLLSLTKAGYWVSKRDRNCAGEVDAEENDLVDESSIDYILIIDAKGVWKLEPVGLDA